MTFIDATDYAETPHIETRSDCVEISGNNAELLLQYASQIELAHEEWLMGGLLFTDDEHKPKDPIYEDNIFGSPMREAHKKASQRQRNRILDPGGEKIKNAKRRRNPKRVAERQRGYAKEVAKRDGRGVETVRAEQEQMRARRVITRAVKAYLIGELGYKEGGARGTLRRLTDAEKDQIVSEPRCARYLDEARQRDRGPQHIGVGVCEWVDPPLPQRDPRLSDSCRPNEPGDNQRIVIERDICKASVSEQLRIDTERFLQDGGRIEVLEDWYPADDHCLFIGGERHIKSTWGYVPHNTRTGREHHGNDE